jgi:uncharacterized protein (TIGR02145 family)
MGLLLTVIQAKGANMRIIPVFFVIFYLIILLNLHFLPTNIFSQSTIQGTVKLSLKQNPAVENALVKLFRLDASGSDTIKTIIDSSLTDFNGYFDLQMPVNVERKEFLFPLGVAKVSNMPNAYFTLTPNTCTTETVFELDASERFDIDDPIEELEVRWDWERDNTWDTEYFANKTANHQYSKESIKSIRTKVRDPEGLTNTMSRQVVVISTSGGETGTLTDIDGNVYKTRKIGNQWWMAENLKVTRYRNGDQISHVTENNEWDGLSTGAYCAFNNDESNVATYGRFYNWYAVNDSRNIAPKGWHVPTDEEWKQLEMFLGMSQSEANGIGWFGTDEGGKLKEAGTTHWRGSDTGATNESGFCALPGGYRSKNGYFGNIGGSARFWSFTESSSNGAWRRHFGCNNSDVNRDSSHKRDGFSVRLLQDLPQS